MKETPHVTHSEKNNFRQEENGNEREKDCKRKQKTDRVLRIVEVKDPARWTIRGIVFSLPLSRFAPGCAGPLLVSFLHLFSPQTGPGLLLLTEDLRLPSRGSYNFLFAAGSEQEANTASRKRTRVE